METAEAILPVLSAIITPSTDPITMAVVFVALYLLYEIGILVPTLFTRTPLMARDAALEE